jgi:endo-1,4-beta-mannosidase
VSERFAVGANYWPASSAMRWWRRFDVVEVGRDFGRLAAAGADLVRFFLLWEDFQPAPGAVSDRSLTNLVVVADAAQRLGLRIMPTLFTGHMSGANFIPEWATGGAGEAAARFRVVSGERAVRVPIRNWYSDELVTRAQELLAREAARTLAAHPALWGWDLGNENSNCCVPPSRDAGRRWLDRMTGAIRSSDPGCQVTLGLHMEDLEEDRRIGPREAAAVCDVLCMHGYPIYASWARSPTDADLVGFLARVTRWLGGKDVLFAEFGAPTRDGDPEAERGPSPLLGEDEAAAYTDAAFATLHGEGTTGGMVWCYADYDRRIWAEPPLDLAPHERHFGVWRSEGTPKPAVSALARFTGRQRVAPPPAEWSENDRASYYASPRDTLVRLYRTYAPLARPVL